MNNTHCNLCINKNKRGTYYVYVICTKYCNFMIFYVYYYFCFYLLHYFAPFIYSYYCVVALVEAVMHNELKSLRFSSICRLPHWCGQKYARTVVPISIVVWLYASQLYNSIQNNLRLSCYRVPIRVITHHGEVHSSHHYTQFFHTANYKKQKTNIKNQKKEDTRQQKSFLDILIDDF